MARLAALPVPVIACSVPDSRAGEEIATASVAPGARVAVAPVPSTQLLAVLQSPPWANAQE